MSPLLTPEQEADAQHLAALIRQAPDDEFLRLARLLVSKDERHTIRSDRVRRPRHRPQGRRPSLPHLAGPSL
jgi:hypothetical protein